MSDCEPLRGKKSKGAVPCGCLEYDMFHFDDVASAVRFYKRYKSYGYLNLKVDHQKVWNRYVKESLPAEYEDADEDLFGYNNWLFDYCFGEVIE